MKKDMNAKIRQAQKEILEVFVNSSRHFALAGGTALELYYLHHRFSADLDFFSPTYKIEEIDNLIIEFGKHVKQKVKFELEFVASTRAKVRFYTIPIKNSKRPLKIDFVEDIIFVEPTIKVVKGMRVYSVENIYLQKLFAIAGTNPEIDEVGRQATSGRKEARDVFDIYMLSKKIKPLNIFLKKVSPQVQRGIIHWYRTFSRQDCKLALLDLDIYDNKFNAKDMLIYLEGQVEKFMKDIIE